MHLTDHAKRRWAERCQGLDLMNEWQSARPLGKKSRQRLRQSCPGHDTRRNHPSYYYRKSKRGVVFVVQAGADAKVITVWRT